MKRSDRKRAITKWSKCAICLEVVQRVTNSKFQKLFNSVVFGILSKRLIMNKYFDRQLSFIILLNLFLNNNCIISIF